MSANRLTRDTFLVSASPKITMDYTASGFTQEDNFYRIDVDKAKHRLTVHVFNWKGDRVQQQDLDGTRRDLISEIELAEW